MFALAACEGAPEPELAQGEPSYTEELRIGVAEGAEPYMIGDVHQMAVSGDGQIFAADAQVGLIRHYDADGTHLGDIGRPGEGPGEYTRVTGLQVLPDGRLVVLDAGQGKVLLFSGHGEHVRGFRTRERGWSGTQDLELDAAGRILARAAINPEVGPHSGELLSGYDIYLDDGALVETLVYPRLDGDFTSPGFVLNAPVPLEPFSVQPVFGWSPAGYLLFATNDRYEIQARNADGATFTFGLPGPPENLLPEEAAEWQAIFDFVAERNATLYGNEVPGPGEVPEMKPYFRRLMAGRNGRVWVWRYSRARKGPPLPDLSRSGRPPLTWRDTTTYDGFKAGGEFIGSVELPLGFNPLVWRDDLVWGVLEDAMGIRFIVRARVTPQRSVAEPGQP